MPLMGSDPVRSLARPTDGRRSVQLASAAVLAAIALYWPTAWSMLDTWLRSDTFAHGLVVVPIALWLAWQQRARFDPAAIRPYAPALVLVLGAGLLWLLSQLAVVTAGRQFALVFMIQAGLIALLGVQFARRFAFALAFLLFAVPFGEFMLPTLMEWTADFTVASLRLSGVPVYREGMDFVIPSGSWSVVEECSGVRYLIASFMGGTLFAYLAYRSVWRRLGFMAIALVVPVVANWVRAYLIVMLGHLSDNKLAAGVDHLIYGWLFFGVVVFVLFWLGARWREPRNAATTLGGPTRAIGTTAGVHSSRMLVATLASLAVWPALAHVLQTGLDAVSVTVEAPRTQQGWSETTSPSAWMPQYAGHRGVLTRSYAKGDARIDVYLAYYRAQSESNSLISSTNTLAASGNQLWRISAQGTMALSWDGVETAFQRTELAGNSARLLVASVFWIDGRVTTSPSMAKLLLAFARLRGRGDDAAFIALATPKQERERDIAHLRTFVQEMSPAIAAALEATRSAMPHARQ